MQAHYNHHKDMDVINIQLLSKLLSENLFSYIKLDELY